MVKSTDFRYELNKISPCLTDFAPSNYYLFPKLEKFICGKCFSSNQEGIDAVDSYFASHDSDSFRHFVTIFDSNLVQQLMNNSPNALIGRAQYSAKQDLTGR